jgi:hypothetical protein
MEVISRRFRAVLPTAAGWHYIGDVRQGVLYLVEK